MSSSAPLLSTTTSPASWSLALKTFGSPFRLATPFGYRSKLFDCEHAMRSAFCGQVHLFFVLQIRHVAYQLPLPQLAPSPDSAIVRAVAPSRHRQHAGFFLRSFASRRRSNENVFYTLKFSHVLRH